jgi:hypothetical protein
LGKPIQGKEELKKEKKKKGPILVAHGVKLSDSPSMLKIKNSLFNSKTIQETLKRREKRIIFARTYI